MEGDLTENWQDQLERQIFGIRHVSPLHPCTLMFLHWQYTMSGSRKRKKTALSEWSTYNYFQAVQLRMDNEMPVAVGICW